MWTYPARVLRIVDADTYAVRIDLGWHVHIDGHVRLLGIDAPEPDTPAGAAAADYATELLAAHNDRVVVRTVDRDPDRSFARYLAHIWLDGADLAQLLVRAGHATRTS